MIENSVVSDGQVIGQIVTHAIYGLYYVVKGYEYEVKLPSAAGWASLGCFCDETKARRILLEALGIDLPELGGKST